MLTKNLKRMENWPKDCKDVLYTESLPTLDIHVYSSCERWYWQIEAKTKYYSNTSYDTANQAYQEASLRAMDLLIESTPTGITNVT